ncbi:MAG TPA: hypothetical protein PKA50_11970 [Gemmatimonadales bacterium]|nr:hypothetical protein [Gemmatimonadales bacterium]
MTRRLASLGAAVFLATSPLAGQAGVPRIALLTFTASPESLLPDARAIESGVRESMRGNPGLSLVPGPALTATQQDSLRAAVRRDTLQGPAYFVGGILTTRSDGRVELIFRAQDVRVENIVAGQRLAAPTVAELHADPDSLVAKLLRDIATSRARRRGR